MTLYRPKGSENWHYDFRFLGKVYRGTTRTKERGLATAIETLKRNEAWKVMAMERWGLGRDWCPICLSSESESETAGTAACSKRCSQVLDAINEINQKQEEKEWLRNGKKLLKQTRRLLNCEARQQV